MVSLIGQKNWVVGDDVIAYWSTGATQRLYKGVVIETSPKEGIARVRFCSGHDTWIPLGWIHKLVIPNESVFK